MHLRLPSSKLGCLLLTYALKVDTPTGVAPAWSRFAGDRLELLGHGVEIWGERVHLQHLQTVHGRRPIYFGFAHKLVPSAGLAPA